MNVRQSLHLQHQYPFEVNIHRMCKLRAAMVKGAQEGVHDLRKWQCSTSWIARSVKTSTWPGLTWHCLVSWIPPAELFPAPPCWSSWRPAWRTCPECVCNRLKWRLTVNYIWVQPLSVWDTTLCMEWTTKLVEFLKSFRELYLHMYCMCKYAPLSYFVLS